MDDFRRSDAAYLNGIDPKTYGQCDHCIEMEGANYSIGVVKRIDGEGYSLVFDTYNRGSWHDGGKISSYIGQACEKLMTAYNTEYVTAYAEANGYMLQQEVNVEGNIVMTLNS